MTQKYRMPVFVFVDSLVGGLMEAVTLPEAKGAPRRLPGRSTAEASIMASPISC